MTTERYLSGFAQDVVDKANVLYKQRAGSGPQIITNEQEPESEVIPARRKHL
ncbi:hypothetical protein [Spirosoma endbachense]|uniref:Uncharacterized protein n=1 Tax=Spirosoma endbachense TaxID=2666025 RepID=A0A6P1W6D0_9BACT|nr:hypothetical protein [Spirosoma endbachense]QHW00566.1 hypothetical protein GJR95_38550 [Spirosoma endbachense]